jgi:hypothetical protein
MSEPTFKKPKVKRKGKEKFKNKFQKKINGRTEAAVHMASTDALPTAPPRDPGPVLPQVKRRKTEGSFEGAMTDVLAPLRRPGFEIRKRDGLGEMTKVKLLPHLVAKDGKITGISFGRNRTPSPFGNKMGDHTGSWASVVDSVHARLYGKDLQATVAELADMQAHAQAWMSDDASTGMKLWNLLDPDDQDRRREVLENYAFTVNDLLTQARALLQARGAGAADQKRADEDVLELLADATAHHLAFLNFLPFATVPAKGDSGSKGSREGTARAKVLGVELDVEAALQRHEYLARETETARAERLRAEKAANKAKTAGETPEQTSQRQARELAEAQAAKEQQLRNARDGLWDLFSMEAAVRAADLDPIVAPTRIAEHVKTLRQLQGLADDVRLLLPGFILIPAEVNPKTGRKRNRKSAPPDRGSGIEAFAKDIMAMLETATELQKAKDLPYKEIQPLVTELINAITNMQGITGNVFANQSGVFETNMWKIDQMAADLTKLVSRLSVDPDTALEDSARLLAHLVHDHQTAVARAYPNAVEQTKFLGEKPDEQAKSLAASRVFDHITDKVKGIKGVEDDQAQLLARRMVELYPGLGGTPAPGPKSRWVVDSRTASLVAAFKGETLFIQGRPAAPPGVGGMGSHTTAWVTEVGWVRKRLAEVGKDKIVGTLQAHAMAELNGDLMTKLAQHLPADQLAAGQLGIIFDAALDVMAATEPAGAVTAYLSFRNLLPYATVDAGNRGGQAERAGADKATLFDGKSLRAAITQKIGEFGKGQLDDTVKTLLAAAASLEKDYAASAEPADVDMTDPDAEPPQLTWKSFPPVKEAIATTIDALRKEAARLRGASVKDTDPEAGISKTIYATRSAEHDRVYDYANS